MHGSHYETEYLVEEGTSVVYLEPPRISQDSETREIGREDITMCYFELQDKHIRVYIMCFFFPS